MQKSQIRVLRIITRMNIGGPAIQISGLMRRLPHYGVEQLLLSGMCGPDESDYIDTVGSDISVTRIESLGRRVSLRNDIAALVAIRRHVKTFLPDVVHTHTAKAGLLGRIAAMSVRPRPKIVHTFHGHLLSGYFGAIATRILIWIEKLLALASDALIAVGPEVKDDLIGVGIGSEDKFVVIVPGVEVSDVPPKSQIRAQFGWQAEGPIVSVVGRVTSIKRPDRMLDVVEGTVAELPTLRVVVAGDGDLRASTEAAAKRRRLPIEFLGWRDDVEMVLAASDVTLLTSDNEGTPLSLIQAALLGVPAVAANVGSVRHVVEDGCTAWLAQPEVPSLTKALVSALSEPAELLRRSKMAREWSNKRFSVDRLAHDHASLYQKLI